MSEAGENTMLIYAPHITERIRYIFDLLMKGLLGIEVAFTEDKEKFGAEEGWKLNYSQGKFKDEFFIYAHNLLFERGVRSQEIAVFDYEDTLAFFSTGPGSAIPFDPFAASFYLVSRYEEYLPFLKDAHNRFPPEASLAYENGFMQKPLVNIWAEKLKIKLKEFFPEINFKERRYEFIPTYDIDMAWSYRNKGLLRSLAGYTKDIKNFHLGDIAERTACLLRVKSDPYDTYEYIKALQDKHGLKPIYFFIVGDFDKYDKSMPITQVNFRNLIKEIADYARVGFHPSYASNYNKKKLHKEKERLEEILKRPVTKSRQHYLMLEFPRTYQNLIDLDITDDFTLGYTSQLGFRAGICTPFYFYNLNLELKSRLRLHPFVVMDATMQYYMKLKPEMVFDAVKPVIDEVKKVRGTLMTLWHNNSFSEDKEWKGWREPYEQIVEYALS